MYSISEFAEKLGVSISTLRRWHKEGKLIPAKITNGGTRYYSEQQFNEYLNHPQKTRERCIIGYCRVSSNKQKDDLERQISNVKTYMYARGYSFEMITDIGSGINYTRKGFQRILDRITNNEVDTLVILYKDRLMRFGYEIIEFLCSKYNTEIEIIDTTVKSEQEELVEDLVQIITVFSCKLQGRRVKKTKELIASLKEGE